MADRIKGITVEIGGDTTKLSDALKKVNKSIKETQNQLKDVNKLLKLDPGNTDLLRQKQKYLSDAIKDTKEKLEQEQAALKQLKDVPQTEETIKQQEALTREIEDTKQALKGGAASLAAFNEVDAGADIVKTKTGAVGQALKDMQDQANDIATSIPTDFETAGSAIGEVNTRFGLTGDALKDLSQQFIEFASVNDTDVSTSIDNVSSVLNAFGMDTSQAGGMLDVLNSVGQATGLSMDTLSTDLSQNAAQLKSMGLNATQSAQFLGNVEMSGLDVSTAMAGMKKAMKNAAADGKTLDQALSEFSDTMHSNKSDTEKLQAAYDLFGSKAGASIFNAMQTGKLSLDGFSSDMSSFQGNVEQTFNDTLDPIDKFKTTMNQLKVTGAEVGNSLATVLAPMLEQAAAALKKFSDFWNGLPEPMQQFIIKAALVAAAVGPILVGVGKVISTFGTITSGIGTLMNTIGGLSTGLSVFSSVSLLPMIGIIAGVVAAIVVVVEIIKHWGQITEWFKGVWDKVCSGVKTVGQGLATFFTGLWNGIKTGTETAWNGIKTGVSTVWNGMKSGAETVFNGIRTHISDAWNKVKTNTSETWDKIKSTVDEHGGGIKGVINTAMEGYKSIWKTGFEVINKTTGGKLGEALSTTRSKLDDIKRAFTEKMDAAKEGVRSAIEKIKGFFNFEWSLPKLKLPHFSMSGKFSLDPPSVPHISVDWYKKAMNEPYILNSPTIFGMSNGRLLGGGEAGEEAVVGTERLAQIVQAAVAGAGGDIVIPIYLGTERIEELVVKASQRVNYRSGGRGC